MSFNPDRPPEWWKYWTKEWVTKLDAIREEIGPNGRDTWKRVKGDCVDGAEERCIQWAIYRVCGPFDTSEPCDTSHESVVPFWRTEKHKYDLEQAVIDEREKRREEYRRQDEQLARAREARIEEDKKRLEQWRRDVRAASTGGNKGLTIHPGALPSLDNYDRLCQEGSPVRRRTGGDWYLEWRKTQRMAYGR